ncbi:preprotein translocase subunit SecG [bacterium]|nr:preprotein translocase subunit SecG [bacterium]
MFTLIIILAMVVSALLILIVLIQNPKGGGIAANFSAANQIAGVKRTNDFVEKATWTLAIVLMVFSLGSSYLGSNQSSESTSLLQEQLENGSPVNAAPQMPSGVNTESDAVNEAVNQSMNPSGDQAPTSTGELEAAPADEATED